MAGLYSLRSRSPPVSALTGDDPYRKQGATRRLFATLIVAAALLLTSYNGSLNWLLLLVFAAILMPGWKPLVRRWLESRDRCEHKERDE